MPSSQTKALCDLLHIAQPIVQAPMAGVSTPALAAAVAEAGALGSIAVGAGTADAARDAIREVRTQTDRSFNVNVFCHRPARSDAAIEAAWLARLRPDFARYEAAPPDHLREIYTSFDEDDAMLSVLLEERPPVVSLHFGLPAAGRILALRRAGIVLLATATSLEEGRAAEAAGVHAVVAQGFEAGGHRGVFDPDELDDELSTFALTRLLVAHLSVPVIAAGGIMDGRDIAATLSLGAAAAQLGTAFVGCPESAADAGYRAALASEAGRHTIMTRAVSGRPARCLANRFTRLGEAVAARDIPAYPLAYDAGKALHAAAKAKGESGYGAQWAGQGAPFARAMLARDLVEALVAELAAA